MSYNNRRNLELARALYYYTELFKLYRADFADRETDAWFWVLDSIMRDSTYNI